MVTTREVLVELINVLHANYAKQLEALPMKKATREILIDGFRDGAREGVFSAIKMLGVEIVESPTKEAT